MGSVVAQPSVSFSITSADAEVANTAQKVLMVGQFKTAGQGVSNGSWHQNIPNDGSEDALFGRTSMLAAMIRGFKKIAPQVQLDAIALADVGTAFRTMDLPISGTSTEQGEYEIIVGSELLHKFKLSVASGEAAATTMANAVTLINKDLDLPVVASVLAATDLRFIAVNAGTVANTLGFEIKGLVAGLTAGVVGQTIPGAVDPSLVNILDIVGSTRYQGIVWPYGDTTEEVTEFLDGRFNVTNAVLDGVAFAPLVDTHALLLTELATAEKNSASLVAIVDEAIADGATGYIGPAQNEAGYLKASYFAAIRALRLTPGEAISQHVTTAASLDQFGGPALASLPYFNTPLALLPVGDPQRGFSDVELEQLVAAGGTVFGQNPVGSAAVAGEVVTTNITDPAGNSDITFKFLNFVDTASGAREYMFNNVKKRFAQSRLTQGRITAGRDMANALSIKGFIVKLYNDLASPAFSLVQDGEQAVNFFKDNLNVTIDMALGKATITMLLPIVTQLRTIIATVKISFDTNQ